MIKVRLRWSWSWGSWDTDDWSVTLCDEKLREFVNLPYDVKTVWLCGSRSKFKESYCVDNLRIGPLGGCYASFDGHNVEVYSEFYAWLRANRIRYVGIEYEDEA